jgi:hypothetical protein
MRKTRKLFGFFALVAIIGFVFDSCSDSGGKSSPALTGTVSIIGNAVVGQSLTANTASLGGSGTISYQWNRVGTEASTAISDAKNNIYIVQSADVGSTITVTVTRAGYSGSVKSNPTAVVTATNKNPVADDFNIVNLTQTVGSVIPVVITPKAGKSGGTITIFYNGSTTLPTAVGTYPVTFNVAAAPGWNAATGLVGGTLSINATNQNPVADDFNISNLTQTVGSVTPVVITPKAGKSGGTITIFYNGSTTLPTTVGTYPVTFNVAAAPGWNAVTGLVGGTLTINNKNPVADDFNIGNLTQTVGSVVPVTITPKEGKSTGAITIFYNGSTVLPTAVGTYPVTFNVAAITDWNAANGLNGGTLTINGQNPVATDFTIINLTQTIGDIIPVAITPKEGKSTGAITIFYNGSTVLPLAVGTYPVTFNVAAVTDWNAANGLDGGTLTINLTDQDPVASDFDIGNLYQIVGSVTAVTVTPKMGKSDGAVTIFYNGSTTLPTAAGTYTVTFNVAAARGWNAANGLSGGTLTINVVANFSITFAQIADAVLPITGPTVSVSGNTGPKTVTLLVDNPGQYSSITWYVASVSVSGASFTLDAVNIANIGEHFLTLEVWKDGKPYNNTVIFTVVP